MPELKRLFLKGRMNKDLDERLVPNGEYRDALNIQVGSSEGSDVGAIENILGNTVGKKKRQGPLEYWELNSASTNYYGLPKDAKCIGGVKDDINDRIFWFVHSSDVDCIIEYDNQYGVVRPVLVDDFTTNGTRILNFEFNKLITGVNILDNYLFFTDDNSEPKKVDVTKGVFVSANFTTHSTYKGRGFIESDITVIKKSPLTAPAITLSSDERGGNAITNATYNAAANPLNTGAIVNAVDVETEVTISLNPNIEVNYQAGDFLKLIATAPEADVRYTFYEIQGTINSFNLSTYEINLIIASIPEEIEDNVLSWDVELVQNSPIFEYKFPRFAYRWKYTTNEYSCFSPFTEVAFLPNIYDFNAKDGYNLGMSNNIRRVDLEITETPPIDVKEIDILYKQSNNASIYVVETLTANNFPLLENLSDITVSSPLFFTITNELIYKIVESDQLLRPWDNVPRLAQAQEIVGNRLLYGNYLQNYSYNPDLLGLSANIISNTINDESLPVRSVKSIRNYQIGVVFKDEYGRETPVFTNKELQKKLNIDYSNKENKIQIRQSSARAAYPAPSFATHYKYFIKESNNQYYNLATDRIYFSQDPEGCWISFPSADRNKLTEEDYIILKKGDGQTGPIKTENKYKILAIENEAPDEITKEKKLSYSEGVDFGDGYPTSVGTQTTKLAGFTPVYDNKTFVVTNLTGSMLAALEEADYIRFSLGTRKSKYYQVVKVNTPTVTSPSSTKVFLTETFSTDIEFMYDSSDNVVANTLETYKLTDRDISKSAFEGRFFVKINSDNLLKESVKTTTRLITQNAQVAYDDRYGSGSSSIIVWGLGVTELPAGEQLFGPNQADARDGGIVFNPGNFGESENPPFSVLSAFNPYDLVLERDLSDTQDASFISAIQQRGTLLQFDNARFIDDPTFLGGDDNTYIVRDCVPFEAREGGRVFMRYYIKIGLRLENGEASTQQGLQSFVNPSAIVRNAAFAETDWSVTIRILGIDESLTISTTNPAVFETESKEQADLDIYYEASDALDVSTYGNPYTLNWSNCFAFGNGVESNRIRDDFNAAFIDTGTKASTVLDEPYEEERRATGIIYSGIYNSNSGLNNLNQFIQAQKITKDLNPIYGSIQKLHARDTNLVALCEDKVLRILANKDALFNADGNVNVTSNNNVLGQAVPYVGEFGISKNPESFASYGYRVYFSDKKRGVVLRLSNDGLTEISSKGMSDYFYDNLKAATTVLGSYDIYSDTYNLTLNNDTVSFKESLDGWPTRKSFIPEFGISLNADYYTFNNGMIWSHDNQNRNTFYEGATEKSSVQLIFNDNPDKIKNFKTLSYEGDNGWTAPLIQTDQQNGRVLTFLDKENIYYNYINGVSDSLTTLDVKQFAAQGIGNLSSVDGYTGNTTFKIVVKNDPADAEPTSMYTVSEFDAEAEVGDQVSLNITEFALLITPGTGYTVTAADFSVPVLPSQISSAVFSQDGDNVKVTCQFDSSFIMPQGDVEILLDIDGLGVESLYTISGNFITTETNTTGTSGTTAFSISGNEGDEITLFTKTFTATAGNQFNISPFYYQDPAEKTVNNYIITYSDTGIGAGKEFIVTSRTYTVKYVIGDSSETLNDIYFVANADLIFTASAELFSYKINLNDIGQKPEIRQIDFAGGAGAVFNLNVTDGGSNNDNYSITLPASGTDSITLSFPNNLAPGSKTWTFTLTGDLASPFTQTNPFTITQLGT